MRSKIASTMNMAVPATEAPGAGSVASSARWALVRNAILLGVIALITWGLRFAYVGRSYDIFVDEANYLSISLSVATTLRMATFEGPFFLHPPAFFYLEAAYLNLVRPAGNIVYQIYAGRDLNTLLAGASAILLILIGHRLAGRTAGIMSAAIFAIEPFIIRMNSRNFIETFATLAILLGYYILFMNTQTVNIPVPKQRSFRHWHPSWIDLHAPGIAQLFGYSPRIALTWPQIVGAGIAFGIALLSKEMTIFLTLLPVGLCFLLNWSISRRASVLIATIACLIYSIYPVMSAVSGYWHEYSWQKTAGIRRFAGIHINTGFTQQSSNGAARSFIQAILANLDQFATTYILIGLGVFALVGLLLIGGAPNRLMAVWLGCAYLQQGYSIKFGTNEEHFFYYLVIPSILAIATVSQLTLRLPHITPRLRTALLLGSAVLGVVYSIWSSYVWVERHFTPDNGNERLIDYMQQHVPAGSCVDTATVTSDWLLHDYNYRLGQWGTVDEVRANGAEYVILSTKLIEQGYDIATPELYQWLEQQAQPVFTFEGPTNGKLILFQLTERPQIACGQSNIEGLHAS